MNIQEEKSECTTSGVGDEVGGCISKTFKLLPLTLLHSEWPKLILSAKGLSYLCDVHSTDRRAVLYKDRSYYLLFQ